MRYSSQIVKLVLLVFVALSFAVNLHAQGSGSCGYNCTENWIPGDNNPWYCCTPGDPATLCQQTAGCGSCFQMACGEITDLLQGVKVPLQGKWLDAALKSCQNLTAKSSSNFTAAPHSAHSDGVALMFDQSQIRGENAGILAVGFGPTEILTRGRLLNVSRRRLIGFQLGWVYSYSDKQSKAVLSKWVNQQDIASGDVAEIPAQGLMPETLKAETGLVSVKFFVAAVRYSGGKVWRENVNRMQTTDEALTPYDHSTTRNSSGSGLK